MHLHQQFHSRNSLKVKPENKGDDKIYYQIVKVNFIWHIFNNCVYDTWMRVWYYIHMVGKVM